MTHRLVIADERNRIVLDAQLRGDGTIEVRCADAPAVRRLIQAAETFSRNWDLARPNPPGPDPPPGRALTEGNG